MRRVSLIVAVLLNGSLWASSAPALSRFEFTEPHMGTLVRLVLYAPDAAVAQRAAKDAFARIAALDVTLSDYRESSELMDVSRRSGGAAVRVSEDLFRVLHAAQDVARRSDGAFDVTSGPLSVLWREARRQRILPDPARVAAARALVGAGKLELDEGTRTVRLREAGMRLDVGGIAKGFAADEAAAVLGRAGIGRALVAAGGDIVVTAPPPGAQGWRIAVADVDGADRPPAGYLTLREAAVSTSGDAEQFLLLDGVRYSHIFDPRSGRAVAGPSSVTVIAATGTVSDALATAVSVLGGEEGTRLVDATEGAAALIVTAGPDGRQIYESKRWRAVGGFAAGGK